MPLSLIREASSTQPSKKVKSLSRARLFATPRIVAWTKLLRPWDFQGKSTGVGYHFLLQGIFPTQESNPGLSHCRQTLYRLSHQGTLIQIPLHSIGSCGLCKFRHFNSAMKFFKVLKNIISTIHLMSMLFGPYSRCSPFACPDSQ